jgi:Xaa-Pro aminopeptidase
MKDVLTKRRKYIFDKIEKESLLLIFSGHLLKKSADTTYKFYTNNNFFYLTNIQRDNVIYLMDTSRGALKETIFIKKRNPELEKWVGKYLTEAESQELSGIQDVRYIEDFDNYLLKILNNYKYENIYFDFENEDFNSPKTLSQAYTDKIKDKYPGISIRNIYFDICEMRRIKDSTEIEKIKIAINITKDAIEYMIKNIKPGMMEFQAEAYFDFILKQKGADQSFDTIAASGKNATILHYIENNTLINDGDLILFDLGGQKNKYSADISRTFPVNGKFTERQKEIYKIVLDANKATIKACLPGTTIEELNEITKNILAKGLKNINLIKSKEELSKYYYHGVSHYLGLDVHDVGDRKKPLEPNCIITIEPGLYIQEENLGIRIEDNILITDSGCINLSSSIVKEIHEIEEMME